LFIIKIWVQGGARFSARDGTVAVGNSGNVILDGVLFKKPTKKLVLDKLNYQEITNVLFLQDL
jgi:hypothetical protein